MRRFTLLTIPIFVLALGTSRVGANGPALETDRFNISFGTYLISFDTTAQLSPVGGVGTAINLEDALGLDDRRTDFRLDGYWRFARRHRLDFGLFYDSRSGNRAISEQIIWNDVTYDVGATIDSKFSTTYLKTAYRFAFVRDDRAEVGLSAGLASLNLAGELAGQGTVNADGTPSPVQFVRESQTVFAPVPVLGLYGAFLIREGLFFRVSGEYFGFNSGGLSGSLVDLRATVDWYFSQRWGVGLGLSQLVLDYKNTDSDPRVDLNTKFGGALLYFSYGF